MKLISRLFAFLMLTVLSACESSDSQKSANNPNPTGDGKGGSLARFAIANNFLYTVSSKNLTAFDISNPVNPLKKSDITIGSGIETIFPYQNMLFIGSQTGMLIYDNSNPQQPQYLSTYAHITSCDPVVVQGNYAYVTLRDGTSCHFGSNLLDVIDISDPVNPQLVSSYPMTQPYGLGVDGNNLFVCQADFGLSVFNLTDPANPQYSNSIQDIHCIDVITNHGLLIITGDNGISQYAYDQNQGLNLLSHLE